MTEDPNWVPLSFNRSMAILKWHDNGRPWTEDDLRIETYTQGKARQPMRLFHFPTGSVATGIGTRQAMVATLHAELNAAADHLVRIRASSLN